MEHSKQDTTQTLMDNLLGRKCEPNHLDEEVQVRLTGLFGGFRLNEEVMERLCRLDNDEDGPFELPGQDLVPLLIRKINVVISSLAEINAIISKPDYPPRMAKCLKCFRGKPTENILEWLDRLDSNLKMAGVAPDAMVSVAKSFLRGNALLSFQRFLDGNSGRTVFYAQFVEMMTREFMSDKFERSYYRQLNAMRQNKMSVDQYIDNYVAFVNQKVSFTVLELVKLCHFENGLNSKWRNLIIANETPITTLAAAIDLIHVHQEIENLQSRMNGNKAEKRKCYYCKQVGHVIVDCSRFRTSK
jgi:hypothetical protein